MPLLATALGTKVAIAVLSLAAIGGGTAVAAAATGALPARLTSAPTSTPTADGTATATATAEPTGSASPSPTPSVTKGPDATGPAAFGLCTAYAAGGLHSTSVAYQSLLAASRTAGSIADYCAPIIGARTAAPGHRPTPTPTPAPESSTDHGRSGSEHGDAASGAHGH